MSLRNTGFRGAWEDLTEALLPAPGGVSDRAAYFFLTLDLILLVTSSWSAAIPLVAFVAVMGGSSVGAGIGLLFAIPKRGSARREKNGKAETGRAEFVPNTSLEDISDWLTKIIVGVGLVQFSSGIRHLDDAGTIVGAAMFPANAAAARPVGISLLMASTLLAALAAYMWFYRHLPRIFTQSFEDAQTQRLGAAGLAQATTNVAQLDPRLGGAANDGVSGPRERGGAGKGDAGQPSSYQVLSARAAEKYATLRASPLRRDDWCKGMFGGLSDLTNSFGTRKLTATFRRGNSQSLLINLVVAASPPPTTPAIFFLHNTFPETTPQVSFDGSGNAVLEISAWGAFTVGVLLDDGTTELELDLAMLPGMPAWFRAG